MIRFACPQCGKQYRKDDQLAGRRAKCSCGYVFRVPGMKAIPVVTLDPSTAELEPVASTGKRIPPKKLAIIAALAAGGLLAVFSAFQGGIVSQVAALVPSQSSSELYRKIYECYKTRTMRRGDDGELYMATPAWITILQVEQRGESIPRQEGKPHYAKVRLRFEDGTIREDDEFVFFVRDDKSVWYTTWGTLAWSNFFHDAIENRLPPLKPGKLAKP